MSVQDKLERTLREMHIMLSRGKFSSEDTECVLINKKDMLKHLGNLNQIMIEMMDLYEATKQSRDRAELEAVRKQEAIIRNSNHQAEDIYAASVLYTDDALGRIQDIMEEAGNSAKSILEKLGKDIEEERRIVRSNQSELRSQLEDLKDTSKYLRIIDDRNKEIAKEKQEAKGQKTSKPKIEKKEFIPVNVDVKINEEYFEQAGLTPDGLPVEEPEVTYSKPEIKINPEYFRKTGIAIDSSENKVVDETAGGQEPEITDELKESLDVEYFEWKEDDGNNNEKKPKPERKFLFGRREKL